MNNYCKRCRLRDGCQRKCKEAEIYEQGYCDAYNEVRKALRICQEIAFQGIERNNGIQRKDP